MKKQNILVFAAGTDTGGGSGFQELVELSRTEPPVLNANVVGVVSNHANGGVAKRAKQLNVDFLYLSGPFVASRYSALVRNFEADFVMLSGWLKFVRGLDPQRTINIHPGPLPTFGGPGFYGHHVHEAVIAAFQRGEIKQSAVSMHYVNEEYDRGPIITQFPVLIRPEDTAETLASRVNEKERVLQSVVLNDVVNGRIWLDGGKVHYPMDYPFRFSGVQ